MDTENEKNKLIIKKTSNEVDNVKKDTTKSTSSKYISSFKKYIRIILIIIALICILYYGYPYYQKHIAKTHTEHLTSGVLKDVNSDSKLITDGNVKWNLESEIKDLVNKQNCFIKSKALNP